MEGYKQYRDIDSSDEVQAIQFTMENGEEVAARVGMEFIPQLEQLFRPGRNDGAPLGAWIILSNNGYVSALYDKDFQDRFTPIEHHPYVATIYNNLGADLSSECGVCRGDISLPYHRDPIDGETLKMYDGTPITIHTT